MFFRFILAKRHGWTDTNNIIFVVQYYAHHLKCSSPGCRLILKRFIYYPKVKEDKFSAIIKMIEQENEDEESRLHLKNSSLPNELLEQYERIKAIESKMGIQMRMPYDLVFRF